MSFRIPAVFDTAMHQTIGLSLKLTKSATSGRI